MVQILQEPDNAVEQIALTLEDYEHAHTGATCLVSRYNPASIRVRIIDNTFHGWSKGERHDYAWGFLSRLPEDVLAQISVLLCLEPGERAPLDWEFHESTRSYL